METVFSKTMNKYGTLRGPQPGKHHGKMEVPIRAVGDREGQMGRGRQKGSRHMFSFFFLQVSEAKLITWSS